MLIMSRRKVDIYTKEGCKYCQDALKALEKPGFKARYALYKVVEADEKLYRINMKSGKKEPLAAKIRGYPHLSIDETHDLEGEEAVEYIRDGMLGKQKTLEKECPYRKFRKCRGEKCSKWTVLTTESGIRIVYCADSLQLELLHNISRKLSIMQTSLAKEETNRERTRRNR
jgi:glutaredoxin